MPVPLFLEPVFQNKIWGGRKLAQEFNYQLPAGKIGECWPFSYESSLCRSIFKGTLAFKSGIIRLSARVSFSLID